MATLIPDNEIIRRLGSYGDILVIQIIDENNNIVDLTSASGVQVKIQHEIIVSDSVIRNATIQGSAVNGTIYYVITKADFPNVGRYKISSIVTYPISSGFPEGKNIISYKTTPNWIINNN